MYNALYTNCLCAFKFESPSATFCCTCQLIVNEHNADNGDANNSVASHARSNTVIDAIPYIASFLARDVIYAFRAYATMSVSVCLSVCL